MTIVVAMIEVSVGQEATIHACLSSFFTAKQAENLWSFLHFI